MADPTLRIIVGVLAAAHLVFVIASVYYSRQMDARRHDQPDAVLTPVDDADDGGLFVWQALVEFDATGNREEFIIRADGSTDRDLARSRVESQIDGAEVIAIDRRRLYQFGPAVIAP